MISEKENYRLAAMEHTIPEWIPYSPYAVAGAGGGIEDFENGPAGGGMDGWGVTWTGSASASGQPVPAPGIHVLTDINNWEKTVRFPDLDSYDWEGNAARQLENVDRSAKYVEYGMWNAQFLRLTHLMGFEEALIALIEEPEACASLLGAITDAKIKHLEYVHRYYKPDIVTSYDDVATERSLFLSPETYRALIKPEHKRFNDAVRALGMIPYQHICGKADSIIGDCVDEGACAWTAVQAINDIPMVQAKWGSLIAVVGGYDSNGKPGRPDATDEEVEAEVIRVINTYGPGGSFVFSGFRLFPSEYPADARMKAMARIAELVEKHGRDFYLKRVDA